MKRAVPPRSSGRRLALAAVGLASAIVLVASFARGPWAEASFALGAALFPVALVAFGAAREARPVPRLALLALGLLLGGSTALLLALSGGTSASRIGGLPVTAWLMLAGMGFAPLVLLGWAFAATHAPARGASGR